MKIASLMGVWPEEAKEFQKKMDYNSQFVDEQQAFVNKWRETHAPNDDGSVWDRMDALVAKEVPDDMGFTITEFAERYKCTRDQANGRVRRFVSKGKLIAGWRTEEGRRVRVFRFLEEP